MERLKQGEFAWTDLSASDLDAQTAFYEGLFGWQHTDVPFAGGMIYRMFSIEGRTVCGASAITPDMAAAGVPSAWNVYIAVDNVDDALARAIGLGAKEAMAPMDVMDRGRYAAIVDPTGAVVFLWHATTPDEKQTYGEPGSLAWNDLVTRDPAKAADFYSALVGWTIAPMMEGPSPYWQANIGDVGQGGIMPMPEMSPPEVPAYWLDYFGTADIAASVAKATELGASVWVPPTEVSGMLSFAVLGDPGGATFALLQSLRDR
jgi:predicted enzyme related to lactoylglutathione lyase